MKCSACAVLVHACVIESHSMAHLIHSLIDFSLRQLIILNTKRAISLAGVHCTSLYSSLARKITREKNTYVIFIRYIAVMLVASTRLHTTHFNLYFSLFTHIPLANKIITKTANYLVVMLCADIRFSYHIFHLCIRTAFCHIFFSSLHSLSFDLLELFQLYFNHFYILEIGFKWMRTQPCMKS